MPLTKRDVYLGRGLGAWAFWLHRLTGLAIAFYLLMHIVVISTVLSGKGSFDSAMAFAMVSVRFRNMSRTGFRRKYTSKPTMMAKLISRGSQSAIKVYSSAP